MVENRGDVGKIKVKHVQAAVEPDLVYPLLRGRDVSRWHAEPSVFIILTQDPQTRKGVPESVMKREYPKTLGFLKKFEEDLRKRSGYRQYFDATDPFWSIYNVGPYTMAPWKVVFKDLTDFFQCAVMGPSQSILDGKPVLPDSTLRFVTVASQDEGYYLAALLNSAPCIAALYFSSVGVQTQRYHATDVQKVKIPAYRATDSQKNVASLSKACHAAAAKGDAKEIAAWEGEINRAAAKLWGITEEELKAIQKALSEAGKIKRPARTDEED